MLGAEQLLRPIDRELLDLIDDFAAAVVALPRQPLGVLVGERGAHGFEYCDRHEVLARDQLEAMLLPRDLLVDEGANLGIDVGKRSLTVSHLTPDTRHLSLINFLDPPLMPTAFESGFQQLVQDIDPLLLTHKLRRQDEQVRVPMLARQLRYLLVPC